MIDRASIRSQIEKSLVRSRAVALLGPRQCGKTTLARDFVPSHSPNYFDLEDPADLMALQDPRATLSPLEGIVVIDEVQRRPDLFPVLRVLLDRTPLPAKFLVLGSASPDLLRQSSESLAGRLEPIEMSGFGLSEVTPRKSGCLWLRGGFPLSFLSRNDEDSFAWRKSFISAFLDRDLSQQGIDIAPLAMHRFWTMLAHSHGHTWAAPPFASSLGVSEPTVRKYLDILTGLFMIRQIQPWHVNIKKRQVKSPKIYLRDTGILHSLLGIRTEQNLLRHPSCGASWEGFVLEEVIRSSGADDFHYWATHQGAEIDLVLLKNGRMYGIEVKRADAPVLTQSMRVALRDLNLEHITVIYPGEKRYSLHPKVTVVPLADVAAGLPLVHEDS